jgi:hypothetical protein
MWGEVLWQSCQQGTAVGDEVFASPEAARVKVEVEGQKHRCHIERVWFLLEFLLAMPWLLFRLTF